MRQASAAAAPALALALIFAGLPACKSAASKTAAISKSTVLGLNDLSILLPLPKPAEVKLQLLTSDQPDPATVAPGQPALTADHQAFVPQAYLAQLDQELAADQAARQKETPSSWQELGAVPLLTSVFRDAVLPLVSVRIVPCANALSVHGDQSQCTAELRLLWQAGAADLNIRSVYHLEPTELLPIIAGLQAMSRAAGINYANEPLQIHPVVSREGFVGPYYRGLLQLLHRYARATRLTAISGLANQAPGDNNHLFSWVQLELGFAGVQPAAVPVPAVTTAPGESPRVVQRHPGRSTPEARDSAGGQINSLGLPSPYGEGPDSLFPGGEVVHPPGAALSQHLAHVESPLRYDQNSLDCASCHRAMALRKQLQINADATEGFKSKSWPLTNATNLDRLPLTALQMFSYRGDQLLGAEPYLPVISQRVINETAFAADFVRDRILTATP